MNTKQPKVLDVFLIKFQAKTKSKKKYTSVVDKFDCAEISNLLNISV